MSKADERRLHLLRMDARVSRATMLSLMPGDSDAAGRWLDREENAKLKHETPYARERGGVRSKETEYYVPREVFAALEGDGLQHAEQKETIGNLPRRASAR